MLLSSFARAHATALEKGFGNNIRTNLVSEERSFLKNTHLPCPSNYLRKTIFYIYQVVSGLWTAGFNLVRMKMGATTFLEKTFFYLIVPFYFYFYFLRKRAPSPALHRLDSPWSDLGSERRRRSTFGNWSDSNFLLANRFTFSAIFWWFCPFRIYIIVILIDAAQLLHAFFTRDKKEGSYQVIDFLPPPPPKKKYVFLNIIYLFYTTQRLPGVDSKAKAEDSSSPSESDWPK